MLSVVSKVLSTHSVAFAILLSNIISALIISYQNHKDATLQNKYQDTRELFSILLEILHDLDFIKYKFLSAFNRFSDSDDLLKKNILKIVLNCQKLRYILVSSHIYLPRVMMACNEIYNFLSIEIVESDHNQISQKIAYLITDLNKSVESELSNSL